MEDEEKARMVRMVRENVLWFLRRGLEGAAEVQRGMVEKRIEREREKEKSVLYKVTGAAGSASMASSVGSLNGGGGGSGGGDGTPFGSGGVSGRGFDVTTNDEGMADVESQLSPEQLQLFAEENDTMLKHYEDTLNKVQYVFFSPGFLSGRFANNKLLQERGEVTPRDLIAPTDTRYPPLDAGRLHRPTRYGCFNYAYKCWQREPGVEACC